MAASKTTLDEVSDILVTYLSRDTLLRIVGELKSVKGNKSFRDSVTELELAILRKVDHGTKRRK